MSIIRVIPALRADVGGLVRPFEAEMYPVLG